MSTRKEEALKVELTKEEVESLHNPKFAGLLELYESIYKQLDSLNYKLQTIQSEMEVMPQEVLPHKIEEHRHTDQMKLHNTQRGIQDLTEYKIQMIKLIKSALKVNDTLDIDKLHTIQIQPLVKFFGQLTAQITILEKSFFTTNHWLKHLEKNPEADVDEIVATGALLNDTATKLLNMQLIRSNLYHHAMNYYESLSEHEKNNLANSAAIYTEELSRNFIQQAIKQHDAQKDLITLSETLTSSQNVTITAGKILKRYNENINELFKIKELLKKCINESAQPELTNEEEQQLMSMQNLISFIEKYNNLNVRYTSQLENLNNHLIQVKTKFGEYSKRNEVANKQTFQYLSNLHQSLSECNKILSFIKACIHLDLKQLNSTMSNLNKEIDNIDKSLESLKERLDKVELHKLTQELNGSKPSPQALHDEKIVKKQLQELNNKYRDLQNYKKIAGEYYQYALLEAKQLRLRAHTSPSTATTIVSPNKPPSKSSHN